MAFKYILLLSLIIPIIFASEYDLTVEVPAGKFQCFYQPVTDAKHKTMEIDYQVIDGADLNVNFMVLFGAEVLVQEVMKTDGTHKFVNKKVDKEFKAVIIGLKLRNLATIRFVLTTRSAFNPGR